ncbi:MAG: thiamine phosphate synthase [Gemmataceae bacterium]|nr:thiamine phosphate synthase [Gemmataceae bacterium]
MDYTPALQRALDAAAAWARRLGDDFIDARSLLLALLDEDEGHAARLCRIGGLLPEDARQILLQLAIPAQADALSRLLAEARALARRLSGESSPGTEHATLAALRLTPDIQRKFTEAGFAAERIWASLEAAQESPLPLGESLQLDPAPDEVDTARILDVNANRAAEALRVIDDFCRFVLRDSFLTSQTKQLRHDLADVWGEFPQPVAVRDTLGDVGTQIRTEGELQRDSLAEVARINLKRLQEALRSIEEFGKTINPRFSQKIEQLRYRSYTLEKAIVHGFRARQRLATARLYLLVTASACQAEIDFVIREAVAGGVQVIQLREKNLTDRELLERARKVRQLTEELGVLFIINDRADVARLVRADGVHLGQDDLPVAEARRIVGPEAFIGVSTHDLTQLRAAILEGADYVGIGPVFPSRTKQFDELAGLEFVRQATAESSLPMFALGGITVENLPQVLDAGADRIAVSAAIAAAEEPRQVAEAFRRLLDAMGRR